MARYAIVVGGVVVNVIEASPEFVAALGGTAIASATAGPGDSWNGAAFTAQTPALVVPNKVTRRQARQALVESGHSLASVDVVIAALPEPTRTRATIFWEDSNEFERHNPMLLALAPNLGLSPSTLDALFIAAAAL